MIHTIVKQIYSDWNRIICFGDDNEIKKTQAGTTRRLFNQFIKLKNKIKTNDLVHWKITMNSNLVLDSGTCESRDVIDNLFSKYKHWDCFYFSD